MRRTRIKFCGITRPIDAVAAAEAGADAIGLNFYQGSSRNVTVAQAKEILHSLPPMVTPVALFVNHKPVEIREITGHLNLHTIQLHGDESPEYLEQLKGMTIVKALAFDPSTVLELLKKWQGISGLLLDTAGASVTGGTGIENNWKGLEAVIATGCFKSTSLTIAGGLTPENVGNVIHRLRPWAVDLSSGIEESRGIKSVDKMQRFAQAVYEADQS